MMHHCSAGAGGTDNRVGIAFLEDPNEMLCDLPRFSPVTGVESWLTTTSLTIVELYFTPNTPEYLYRTDTNVGPKLIHKTSYEKRNFR
jgi:hypothetical protein